MTSTSGAPTATTSTEPTGRAPAALGGSRLVEATGHTRVAWVDPGGSFSLSGALGLMLEDGTSENLVMALDEILICRP